MVSFRQKTNRILFKQFTIKFSLCNKSAYLHQEMPTVQHGYMQIFGQCASTVNNDGKPFQVLVFTETILYKRRPIAQRTTIENYQQETPVGRLSPLRRTFTPRQSVRRRSAGIRSPPLISTRSPITNCSARILFFSPSRITVAKAGIKFLNESIMRADLASW